MRHLKPASSAFEPAANPNRSDCIHFSTYRPVRLDIRPQVINIKRKNGRSANRYSAFATRVKYTKATRLIEERAGFSQDIRRL